MLAPFLHGAVAATCLLIGVVFLKYWRLSRDRFYLWFAAAFWTFAAGATIQTLVELNDEHGHLVYVPRLVGFVLILVAIIDKNRQRS